MSQGAYFASPWPAEDGGPRRLQVPRYGPELALQPEETLGCITRNTLLSTMTVLGAPGEVFLLTHSALRARLGLPTTSCVERIDPLTLKTVARSPRLPGGPMWPGGMAVHRDGQLIVVYGRYAHTLSRDCTLLRSMELPINAPYNSFVILDNGLVVTKNLSETVNAHLTVLDPDTLAPVCAEAECPEPSVARLSASGNSVYVVGVRSIFRYHWSDEKCRLVLDPEWGFNYAYQTRQTFGWDVVIDGTNAWFMDNGKHRYLYTMLGAGVSPTSNRLIRVSLQNSDDTSVMTVSGLPAGSVTNPPLFDLERSIVVAYDSANGYLTALRFDASLRSFTLLWTKKHFGCASHMILYPRTGQLVVNDYRDRAEEVVMLNIDTGTEIARVKVGGITQGVVFPSVGWNRDFYWSSMGKLARVFVQPGT